MDTLENMGKLTQAKVQNVIEKFCRDNNYIEIIEIMENGKLIELIEQIYNETNLSNRKIADPLKIGVSRVSRAKKNRQTDETSILKKSFATSYYKT